MAVTIGSSTISGIANGGFPLGVINYNDMAGIWYKSQNPYSTYTYIPTNSTPLIICGAFATGVAGSLDTESFPVAFTNVDSISIIGLNRVKNSTSDYHDIRIVNITAGYFQYRCTDGADSDGFIEFSYIAMGY